MTLSASPSQLPIGRRRFLQASLCGAAGAVLYPGEIERHWIDVTHHDSVLPGLAPGMNGMRIVQLSDIHLDEYTEPYFLRQVVDRVNRLKPDAVFLTGDFVSDILGNRNFALGAARQCAQILSGIQSKSVYAILGNHDVAVDAKAVTAALESNGAIHTCRWTSPAAGSGWPGLMMLSKATRSQTLPFPLRSAIVPTSRLC